MTEALQAVGPPLLDYRRVAYSALRPHQENPRQGDVESIGESIDENGVYKPVVVAREGTILAGHHVYYALGERQEREVDVVVMPVDPYTPEARRIMAADNHTAEKGGYDEGLLIALLTKLRDDGALRGSGYVDDEVDALKAAMNRAEHTPLEKGPSMADRFLVPPLSVLDQRGGTWRDRKRVWLDLGIQSEVGRSVPPGGGGGGVWLEKGSGGYGRAGDAHSATKSQGALNGLMARAGGREDTGTGGSLYQTYQASDPDYYRQKNAAEEVLGRALSHDEFVNDFYEQPAGAFSTGTSIFDPVLCELAYRWFCPPGGTVLDPFAGGSVRGIVAAALGRQYVGMELREEQVAANEDQRHILARMDGVDPRAVTWLAGDSLNDLPAAEADMVFSCPPYFDLEVYSEDKRDLSAMAYGDFLVCYRSIIEQACRRLRPDRFAAWVISPVRVHKGGFRGGYYDLTGETVRAFEAAGLAYYNEAILVQPVGSLPFRAGRVFSGSRKLGRTHQNVLVFVKGDPRAATAACGDVEVTMPDIEDTGDGG